jgi:alpha-methylacyl-CoA racemase
VTQPLEDITVIELAGLGPIPFAGMVLAGMGAEVILIDRPGGPPIPDVMVGAVGRGKRSVAIDLKHPRGPSTLLRLVAGADALIEGFRPGVVERLGVGPEECFSSNPDLIYGRMTGWGRSGPYATMAGHDINYIGLTGALDAIGDARGPLPPLNLIGDYGGGAMYLVAGLLAALLGREGSGGRVVEAAMVDGATSLMSPFYEMLGVGAWQNHRAGNLLDGGAPFYTTYATSDNRHVAVGALEPQFYAALLEGLGLDEADLPDRLDRARWPELRDRLAEVFVGRTMTEWEVAFEGTDGCVTPVLDMSEAPLHPVNRERGVFTDDGLYPLPAPAPRFDVDLPAELAPASDPGQHTDEILSDAGFDESEISALRAEGAVG